MKEESKLNSFQTYPEKGWKVGSSSNTQSYPYGNSTGQTGLTTSSSSNYGVIEKKVYPSFSQSLQKNFGSSKYAKMQSNLSYLKVLAILLVTMTHTMRDLYQTDSPLVGLTQINGFSNNVNPWIFMFLQVLSIACVNIFVCVSCYLENKSLKVKFFKFIKLYLIIVLVLCVTQSIEWIIAACINDPRWAPATAASWQSWLKCFIWFYYEDPWYFTAYFAFLLMVPFVNVLFSKLSLNGKNVAFGIVIFIFIVWKGLYLAFSNAWGFTGSTSGTQNSPLFAVTISGITDSILGRGYNFLNFFVIYVIVQWLIAHDFFRRFKYGWMPLYLFAFALMYILSVWVPGGNINAFMYSNPLVILMSICLLGAFLNLKCKNRKWINYLSTLTMYVFVCHWNQLGQVFIYQYFEPALNHVFWGSDNVQWTAATGPLGTYTGSASFMGWFTASQDMWVLCWLLWWVILSVVMYTIAMIVDALFKFFTAIPAWQKMIDWMKTVTKLDKFENIIEITREKKEEKAALAATATSGVIEKPLNDKGNSNVNNMSSIPANNSVTTTLPVQKPVYSSSDSIDKVIEEKMRKKKK